MNDTGRIENATGTAADTAPGDMGSGETFRQLQYTIARGDTLLGIDTRFRICRDDVAQLNSGFDAYNLQPGQTLTLGRTTNQPFTATCA